MSMPALFVTELGSERGSRLPRPHSKNRAEPGSKVRNEGLKSARVSWCSASQRQVHPPNLQTRKPGRRTSLYARSQSWEGTPGFLLGVQRSLSRHRRGPGPGPPVISGLLLRPSRAFPGPGLFVFPCRGLAGRPGPRARPHKSSWRRSLQRSASQLRQAQPARPPPPCSGPCCPGRRHELIQRGV